MQKTSREHVDVPQIALAQEGLQGGGANMKIEITLHGAAIPPF